MSSEVNIDGLTAEEHAKILLGLHLLAVRQERLSYGDPRATRELKARLTPKGGTEAL